MTIKLFDGLFHHHDHFICTAKNEKHFHEHHDKCPIPGFELSLFSAAKQIYPAQKLFFCAEIKNKYVFTYCCKNSLYSFLLRAPPLISKTK
jgi:hypothetical protein